MEDSGDDVICRLSRSANDGRYVNVTSSLVHVQTSPSPSLPPAPAADRCEAGDSALFFAARAASISA